MDYQYTKVNGIFFFRSTNDIMLLVILAIVPGIIIECYYFKIAILIQILLASFASVIFELFVLKLRKKDIYTYYFDFSPLLTGILLGLSLPAYSPWWMSIIGSFFSIVITKQLYGGLGYNIFNPAMAGYAILLVSFPVLMTNWSFQNNLILLDTLSFKDVISIIFFTNLDDYYKIMSQFCDIPTFITQVTPLEQIRIHNKNVLVNVASVMSFVDTITMYRHWILINFGFFIGGIFLLIKKIICWRISFSILLSLFSCYLFDFFYLEHDSISPLIQLFLGSTMISVFFIATDPVTTSITKIGRIIFGGFIGVLIWIIRTFGGYPDAISFSILLANSLVPLIDHYTQPRIYGKIK
ncbi:MAG: RnfABCDGE type electron transport complex subunit D [Buchnera aphidicola (Kaburagia rhusicola rhusicola)]